ncbi:MAG: transcription elongation factor GreA [Chloroflexota bacterium]
MTERPSTLGDVAAEYLATLPQEERADYQQEIWRFARWFGPERPITELGMRILESYQAQMEATGADSSRRFGPLRAFFIYAEGEGYLPEKLSKYIKIKRAASRGRRGNAVSEAMQPETIRLTAEGYNQLKEEYDNLVNVQRPQVSESLLEARRDKDIRENAPYDAAKQQQGYIEARIRELEHILGAAEIMGANKDRPASRVTLGSTVLLRDLSFDEEVSYTLVSSSEANPREGKLSVASPVGKALLDAGEGAVVEVEAPAGKLRYRVEKIAR